MVSIGDIDVVIVFKNLVDMLFGLLVLFGFKFCNISSLKIFFFVILMLFIFG